MSTTRPSRARAAPRAIDAAALLQRAELEPRALLAARTLVDRMRALYRELEQFSGAPISVHRALNGIGAEPGIQASRLAAALGMQRPAMSHVLGAMVERGWIERVRPQSDQRAVRIYLTAAGRRMLQLTAGRAAGILQRSMRALSDADVERLAVALPALVEQLQSGRAVARRAP
ncbi:MAG: MarR family transcriptional regulator [Gammaproteobacteria bacterium]|nr:MarR family transcriptional regulator [Gammaproteobacteria bacterium]